MALLGGNKLERSIINWTLIQQGKQPGQRNGQRFYGKPSGAHPMTRFAALVQFEEAISKKRHMAKVRCFTAWIGLVAYLVIGLSVTPDMVLCLENDGHISLETSINGVCRDSFGLEETQAETISPTLSCNHCVDIPLHIESALPTPIQQTPFVFLQDTNIPEATNFAVGYLATATETILPKPPPVQPAIHRLLNTVVLLI